MKQIPYLTINREAYLVNALTDACPNDVLMSAIAHDPATAGIDVEVLDRLAQEAILDEMSRAGSWSFAAGMPWGWALAATAPIDLTQFIVHLLRLEQKLCWLYGRTSVSSATMDATSLITHGGGLVGFGAAVGALEGWGKKALFGYAARRAGSGIVAALPIACAAANSAATIAVFKIAAETMRDTLKERSFTSMHECFQVMVEAGR